MVVVGRLGLASVLAFALVGAEPPAPEAVEAARSAGDLDADDECSSASTVSGDESCAMNALQRRAAASRLGSLGLISGEAAPSSSESTTAGMAGTKDAGMQPVLIPGSKAAGNGSSANDEDSVGDPSEEVARSLESTANVSNASSEQEVPTTAAPGNGQVHFSGCLCVFGIDRTLTAAQGHTDECEGSKPQHGIEDIAFGGGGLLLSQLGAEGLTGSFCENCQVGLTTKRNATGGMERMVISDFLSSSKEFTKLLASLNKVAFTLPWDSLKSANAIQSGENLSAPIVTEVADLEKPVAVGRILDWYGRQGIHIKADYAYFFDDRKDSVEAFATTSVNARQVSCQSRDAAHNGSVGFCGATTDEIQMKVGVYSCDDLGMRPEAHLAKAEPNKTDGKEKTKTKGAKK